MGLCLIAATWEVPLVVVIIEVAVGLGMVIFVHELGHFAVAKMCGVKCEKFYLGFDIYGLKQLKFTRGETEYGIGILPLGGYVKMLGQEDNPARLKEEIERAKHPQPEAAENDAVTDKAEQAGGNQINRKAAEAALYDSRSYLAKSVPQRMAIISAGVIMNVVFAFVLAMVAYGLGVKQIACGVGYVSPGGAAWKAGIMVGDHFEEIAGETVERFNDLRRNVTIGDIDDGVEMLVRRPGVKDPFLRKLHPDLDRLIPMVGVGASYTTTLRRRGGPVVPGSPAAMAVNELKSGKKIVFESGDKIVKIDGQPMDSYADIHAYLALHPDKRLAVTIERPVPGEDETPETPPPPERLVINVDRNPMRRLGLVMKMGQICAIQAGSPAAAAVIEPGDKIIKIDFDPPEDPHAAVKPEPPGDPMTLPERLRRLAGKRVCLYIQRHSAEKDADSSSLQPHPIPVELREAGWYEAPEFRGNPIAIPSLGIAYRVQNRVQDLEPGSAAAQAAEIAEAAQMVPVPALQCLAAGLRDMIVLPGDEIIEARLIPPDEETLRRYDSDQEEITVKFNEKDKQNWPVFIYTIQRLLPQTRVELTWKRNGKQHTATFKLEPGNDWFSPDRGFHFEPESFIQIAHSLGEAVRFGGRETVEALTMVVQFLKKIGTQISPKAVGGPITIAKVAGRFAQEGIAKLLIFLCILSANLAVINFLPIPLLDGGHMVLLAWEGIRGKPANERVQVVLTYIGLFVILGLMVWVIGLDLGLIPRF